MKEMIKKLMIETESFSISKNGTVLKWTKVGKMISVIIEHEGPFETQDFEQAFNLFITHSQIN